MWKSRKIRIVVISLLLIALVGFVFYRLLMPGTAFLLLMQDKNSAPVNFEIREEIIPGGQPIPTKIYSPNSGSDRAVLLIHGVHWGGYDEERLVRFAKILTQFGLVVATPDIESLKNYNIHSTATDEIEDCAKWLAQRYPQNKIGMMGISFAGGLSICAAGRPSLRDKISAVFSFGGHGDLDRAIQYLVDGNLPDGGHLEPHIYGQAVLARRFANQLVPQKDVDGFRQSLLFYLQQKHDEAKKLSASLGSKSQELVELCLKRDTKALSVFLSTIRPQQTGPNLSPEKCTAPDCPVFLLHGSDDNVIPASETMSIAAAFPGTHALVSPLITHVELEDDRENEWLEYWQIIHFWTELLRKL